MACFDCVLSHFLFSKKLAVFGNLKVIARISIEIIDAQLISIKHCTKRKFGWYRLDNSYRLKWAVTLRFEMSMSFGGAFWNVNELWRGDQLWNLESVQRSASRWAFQFWKIVWGPIIVIVCTAQKLTRSFGNMTLFPPTQGQKNVSVDRIAISSCLFGNFLEPFAKKSGKMWYCFKNHQKSKQKNQCCFWKFHSGFKNEENYQFFA